LAVTGTLDEYNILQFVNPYKETHRKYTTKERLIEPVWTGGGTVVWCRSDDVTLQAYCDREILKELTPANLTLEIKAPAVEMGSYQLIEVMLQNIGERQAKNLSISVAGDFKTADIPIKYDDLSGRDTLILEISINPQARGQVPIIVSARYEDEIDGVKEVKKSDHIQVKG
jgi:hypothetical protein